MRTLLAIVAILYGTVVSGADDKSVTTRPAMEQPAVIVTERSKLEPLSAERGWSKVPAFLKGCQIHDQPLERAGAFLVVKVEKPGVAVILASRQKTNDPRKDWAMWKNILPELTNQGWTAVAEVTQLLPGAGQPQPWLVFRRNVAAGQAIAFPEGPLGPPRLMILDDKLAATIAARKPLVISSNDLSHIRYPLRRPGAQVQPAGQTVFVDSYLPMPAFHLIQGILQRELFRQALLIAARDELGLATRDRTLRDDFPTGEPAPPAPFGVIFNSAYFQVLDVTVFREGESGPEPLLTAEKRCGIPPTLEEIIATAEQLSRNEFVGVLQDAGYERRNAKPAAQAAAAVPESVENLLTDFNFLAGYEAVRRLHRQIAQSGESPALVAALARAYANLGAATDYLNSAVHKALEARGLLYAERLVARHPDVPDSYWTRAYVRALVGLHRSALEDLKRAAELRGKIPQPAKAPPAWVAAIDACCRFDRKRQETLAGDARLRRLIRFFNLLEVYGNPSERLRSQSALAVLEDSADCWKAVNIVSYGTPLGVQRAALEQVSQGFPASLYRRLETIPDLPDDAAQLCAAWRKAPTAGNDEGDDAAPTVDRKAEAARRTSLLQSLRIAKSQTKGGDEPSFGLLAHLVEETEFRNIWGALSFGRNVLAVPVDDLIEQLSPFVAGHRFKDLLLWFGSDHQVVEDAVARLWTALQASELELEWISLPMVRSVWSREREPTGKLLHVMTYRIDPVYRDLAGVEVASGTADQKVREVKRLVEVSPHSPLAIAGQIDHNWQAVEKQAAELEQTYADELVVVQALSNRYRQLSRWDDAERCLKREVKIGADYAAYDRLARFYKQRGQRPLWRATLEEFLRDHESRGLEHARVQVTIADDLMAEREYGEALPYAVAAAETYASWALLCAHRCCEALEDWEQAEAYVRAASLRYDNERLEWLKWCCQSGRGDLAAARQATARWVASLGDPPAIARMNEVGAFHLLTGDHDQALETFERAFQATADPFQGLHAALAADALEKPELRDKLLKDTLERGKQPRAGAKARVELSALAGPLSDSLASGKESKFNFEAFDALLLTAAKQPGEVTNLRYFAGRFLLVHGHRDKGLEQLKLAATSKAGNFNRALARMLLRQEGESLGPQRDAE